MKADPGRVQVNGRYLVQRVTGVQRYAREIVARFPADVEVISPRGRASGLRGHLWEQTVLPCRLRRGLLWSPCATGPLAIRHHVVTIHDCAFFDCPECFAPAFARWYQCLVPRLARRAAKVLTVSNFSRDRICERLKLAPEKIAVVPCGVSGHWSPAGESEIANVLERWSLTRPYVLYVGSIEPRKNLRRLLQAWQQMGDAKNGAELILVGAANRVFRDAGLQPPADVRALGFVPDDDLRALASGCAAFVFPSLYEGFGLPVLEAMACGAPVVCSSATALPEVAGDAALLVDPLSADSIAAGLAQVLADRDLCAALRERGFRRAAEFSWDRAARQVWEVLTTAL
jgi:glycosyltransferase involved in cell wall biosynthesis